MRGRPVGIGMGFVGLDAGRTVGACAIVPGSHATDSPSHRMTSIPRWRGIRPARASHPVYFWVMDESRGTVPPG
jgi:hypothetical protein